MKLSICFYDERDNVLARWNDPCAFPRAGEEWQHHSIAYVVEKVSWGAPMLLGDGSSRVEVQVYVRQPRPSSAYYVVVRDGPFRYLSSEGSKHCFARERKSAVCFISREEARKALRWESVLASSWPCRVAKVTSR